MYFLIVLTMPVVRREAVPGGLVDILNDFI